jgi:hypothetical protein
MSCVENRMLQIKAVSYYLKFFPIMLLIELLWLMYRTRSRSFRPWNYLQHDEIQAGGENAFSWSHQNVTASRSKFPGISRWRFWIPLNFLPISDISYHVIQDTHRVDLTDSHNTKRTGKLLHQKFFTKTSWIFDRVEYENVSMHLVYSLLQNSNKFLFIQYRNK